jgi:4-methoxybenzoate monooxygenase (O-demethylating)
MATTTIDSRVPRLDVDPYSGEFLSDPYPYYTELREAGPFVWLTPRSIYATCRYDEARTVLGDWETFTTNRGFGLTDLVVDTPLVDTPEYAARFRDRPEMNTVGMRMLLDGARADPPEHTAQRKIINRVLTPAAVRRLRDRFTREAEELVERVVARGGFDAATDLSDVYVLKMLCDATGLPEEGREHLIAYGDMAMNTSGPRDTRYLDSIERAVPAIDWVEWAARRENVSPGGFGAEFYALADAGELTEEEASIFVRIFPIAGFDTTASTIANAIYNLAQNPDQWAFLRDDPSLARKAFQETLRYDLAPQPLFRAPTRDVELSGVTLAEGRKVLVLLGGANRDPRRFEHPDRFDIHRDATGHVGFGLGIHACAGQMMASLEAECLLGALARRVERIELDGEPTRRANNTLHTWANLPVRVTLRAHTS